MNYSDFKPASRSYELLGAQAEEPIPGDSESQVKLVIYRNVDLATVKKTYPTFGGKPTYHFIEYAEAIAFLDKQINQLQAEERDQDVESVRLKKELISECEQTRAKIVEKLGGQ